jgi:Uma2 family endonuclease
MSCQFHLECSLRLLSAILETSLNAEEIIGFLMSTVEQTYTPEDLLRMPDGDRFELVDGQLVEKVMGMKSGWVAGRVFKSLAIYEDQHGGHAFPDGVSYQCFPFDPGLVRRPDASFICAGRFENDEIPEGHCPIHPDLAVEMVSPNDMYRHVEEKVEEYLRAGVRLVWVLNPENHTVRVFEDKEVRSTQLGPSDELTAPEVLPGFRCRISDLFKGAPRSAD